MNLWKGRLSGELDKRLQQLNASIGFDSKMYKEDIEGSIAHAAMLGKIGVLTEQESTIIQKTLRDILEEIHTGKLPIDQTAEDIHMFVEQELTGRLGDLGKKLHTARSRNDQVALDLRLYLLRQTEEIYALAHDLAQTVIEIASRHLDTVMPGYTHMQRAQPVTLAHHLMAYVQMLLRDMARMRDCQKRITSMPLGSGALAGTSYPLDRKMVCDALGFSDITKNSMDGVSDRDFVLELSSVLSILMMHLSRFSEEIILWCSWEFRFASLDDHFSTGSSIMPQKKNPDLAELVRGKTARVYGSQTTLFCMMKALPLAYNKDMQEDKEAIFDAVDTVKQCLAVFAPMLSSATFYPENMKKAAAQGFINATDCADYLVGKGIPFRDAYAITGKLVNVCLQKGCTLETLPLDVYKQASTAFGQDIYQAIDLQTCVRARKLPGGPAPSAVKQQIHAAKEQLEQEK